MYGIIQGRLTQSPPGCLQWFPQAQWDLEFSAAASLGFSFLELIAERKTNSENPIWHEDGRQKIKSLCDENKLFVYTLCDDYVVDHDIRSTTVLENTLKTLDIASQLGAQKFILPLFEHSEITENNLSEFATALHAIAASAKSKNIMLCLETLLDGKIFLKLVEIINHPNLFCVFDTGNRVNLAQDLSQEVLILNKLIQHVHVKDKNKKGENVLLGTGQVNFHDFFLHLNKINYQGCYTFETTRGRDPLKTAKFNKAFVDFFRDEVLR